MTNDDKDLKPAINTDQTIYRQPTTDYGPEDGNDKGMEPSVFVTKEGAVGFNHYGKCVVKPIKEWVEMAWNTPQQPNDDKDLKPMTIEEVYKKYNIDNSKKKSIYLWEFQVITQEFVSDMWEAIKHHATRPTPQQPSEPLKELDEQDIIDCIDLLTKFHNIHFVNIVGKEWNFSYWFKVTLAKEIYKKFGQPTEKNPIASIRESFKEEYIKTYPSQPSEKKAFSRKEVYDLGYADGKAAQREVRYPEKLDHDHSCEFDCKGCISNGWNQAINKMRKLNGDKT